MPSGGARARSGPPPDPNALRRDRDAGEWMTLPAEGRLEPAPAWPLPALTDREAELWAELWRKPQAVAWERLGQELEVALYVRRFGETEEHGAPTNLGTLVRQMSDSLGISTPGLRANRWRIASTSAVEAQAARVTSGSARSRLRVVPNADVGD